jgi:divalent metal cation (Fe/Co/Zn/Cd) transporter
MKVISDDLDADDVENLADRIDRRLAEILPERAHVFIDPTQRSGADPHKQVQADYRGPGGQSAASSVHDV